MSQITLGSPGKSHSKNDQSAGHTHWKLEDFPKLEKSNLAEDRSTYTTN